MHVAPLVDATPQLTRLKFRRWGLTMLRAIPAILACCAHGQSVWQAGRTYVAPLVDEMLSRIEAEVRRYERVITYWRVFGPQLEGAVCASLRETTAAVTRQCGLAQV